MPTTAGLDAPRARIDLSVQTAHIWTIVFLPLVLLPLVYMLQLPWLPLPPIEASDAQLSDINLLARILLQGGSFAVFGFTVALAFWDYRTLLNRGIPAPFHWALALFGSLVYVVGRSLVVRARTGHGLSPLVTKVVIDVLALAAVIWIAVTFLSSLFDNLAGSMTG
ncbi:hypothetical protein AB0O95_06885 [Rhodoglobus sp. NPDC076762]